MLLASLVLIASVSGASAYCYPVPETAKDGYTGKDAQRMICIQNELDRATQLRSKQVEIDATIGKLQRDMVQQKFELQTQRMFASPAFP